MKSLEGDELIETPDGRRVNVDSSSIQKYEELLSIHKEILSMSGMMWNWPTAATLSRPSVARILWLAEVYDLILSVPGSILEFGVHLGTSSSILTNLRAIKEPHNYNRELFIFDTFEGFVGTSELDGVAGGDGKFSTPLEHEKTLDRLLGLQESLNPLPMQTNHKIYKGDASIMVNKFLNENPQTVVSLAIFDMDLYGPTRDSLEAILPRLIKGSILVFDQFSFAGYPGETLAVQDVLGLGNLKMNRSALMPHCAWTRFGD